MITTWATTDPESELVDAFGQSLMDRAKKRTVIAESPSTFIVIGNASLGDAYDEYHVHFDGRRYRCSCRDHLYGQSRKFCSHALAVVLFRRANKNASGAGVVEPPGPAPDAQDVRGGEATVNGSRGGGSDEGERDPDLELAATIPAPDDPRWTEGKGCTDPLPEWVKDIRRHQWDAVGDVMAAYEGGARVVIVDAPTGAGKTLLAELVRRELNTRGLYVCTTKSLQEQVVADFPYARVLKGRANYPTHDHPEKFDETDRWGQSALTAADCTKGKEVLPACAGCPSDPSRDGVEVMHCLHCHPVSACAYERAKWAALSADLAVLNTSYFLTEANSAGKFSGAGFVVCDEADLLESELMGAVEVRVGERVAKGLGLGPPDKKTVEAAWVEWVREQAIPAVTKAVRRIPATTTDVKKLRERTRWTRLLDRLRMLDAGLEQGGWIYGGWSGDGDAGEIVFRPVRVDGLAPEMLWSHGERFLLMSASVISADEIVESLGLGAVEWVKGVAA